MNTGFLVAFISIALMPVPQGQAPATTSAQVADPEAKLKELGIALPKPPAPVANYVNAVRAGNLLFLAGKGPTGQTART